MAQSERANRNGNPALQRLVMNMQLLEAVWQHAPRPIKTIVWAITAVVAGGILGLADRNLWP